jgi:hypothetical protein
MPRKARVTTAVPAARRRATRRGARQETSVPDLPEAATAAEEAALPGAEIQPTSVAVEAAATGVLPPLAVPEPLGEIPGPEGERMQGGDPDVSPLRNEYSGEEMPGASTPTPDQNSVDDIGRAYGVEEEDSGTLRTASEILERRDRHRQD